MTNKLFITVLKKKKKVMCIQRNKIAVGFGVKEVLTSGSGLLLTNCVWLQIILSTSQVLFLQL